MLKSKFIIWLILLVMIWPAHAGLAQQAAPAGAVYIVEAGDTLGDIARRFGVSVDQLMDANNITNPNIVSEGAPLIIPGLSGVEGVLTTTTLSYGETLSSLSRKHGMDTALLARLNRIVSPAELYAGADLIILQAAEPIPTTRRVSLAPGQSTLELAVMNGLNPWDVIRSNHLSGSAEALSGEVLRLPGIEDTGPGGLPPSISSIEINPLPLRQGRTGSIQVTAPAGLELSGSFLGHPLNFFSSRDGLYTAIQGVHAMTEPGYYPLELNGNLVDGTAFQFIQQVGVGTVNYPFDRPLQVDPATIDPAITRPEEAQWVALTGPVTPERMWSGVFKLPSPLPVDYCLETNDCWTSRFGNRRSYNGSEYLYFHTGLDIAGGVGVEIYAPAPGRVVFAGPLTVRGNATVIDHGWGVYSAYMHQSEMFVQSGDLVQTGQKIGLVGATGRVEGPHLHWEIWAGGVQVDPLEWLQREFP